MKTTKHVLRTSAGVTVEMTFDESDARFSCTWSPGPPFSPAVRKQIAAEYLAWRDAIIADWSKRTGKRVIVVTV